MTTTAPTPAEPRSETGPGTDERDRWFLGTYRRIVTGGGETGGALAVMEQRARRGFSPPRHVHHGEDTALLVLEGALTVSIGEEISTLEAGEMVWLPRDVAHTFRVDSDEARLLELLTPAGFEQFHIETSEQADTAEIPQPEEPDVARLLAAISPYRAEIVGPPLGPD